MRYEVRAADPKLAIEELQVWVFHELVVLVLHELQVLVMHELKVSHPAP